MLDESKVPVALDGGRGPGKSRRVVDHQTQVTYKPSGEKIVDVDFIRRPRLVKNCTAAACATVAGDPDDACGLAPGDSVRPLARYFGSLMATDYPRKPRMSGVPGVSMVTPGSPVMAQLCPR